MKKTLIGILMALVISPSCFATFGGNPQKVVNGGTGQGSYTNGQLLIGNTSTGLLTKSTLTAGSNISITNGAGSITIAATSGGSGNSYSATIGNNGTCSITGQTGSWLSSVSHTNTGQCQLNTSVFSTFVSCVCNAYSGSGIGNSRPCNYDPVNSTLSSILIDSVGTGFGAIDLPMTVVCVGS